MKRTALIIILLLNSFLQSQELPYPIIIVHGLNSSELTWDTFDNFFHKTGGEYRDPEPGEYDGL